MAAHGARRLLGMVENATAVIGIEWLTAAQGCDFHRPLTSSAPLEAARTARRAKVESLDDDRHMHPDMVAAIAMVRDGTLVAAVGEVALPALVEAP